MPEGSAGAALTVAYTAVALADLIVVADIISNGALHRWAVRQIRAAYHAVTDPFAHEAEVRKASAWVVWEAMQLLEEAARP